MLERVPCDMYWRGSEHLADAMEMDSGSHIWNYLKDKHPGVTPETRIFCMRLVKAHKTALCRQIHEAILVRQQQENILNSKTEYSRCYIPQLGIEGREYMQPKDAGEKIRYW